MNATTLAKEEGLRLAALPPTTTLLTLRVNTAPVPYRERQRVAGGRTWSYLEPKTRDFERIVRGCAIDAMAGRPPWSVPICLDVAFYMPIPQSMRSADRLIAEQELLPHVKRPDRTSLLRAAEDPLSGVVWLDDNQVCDGVVRKLYSLIPRVDFRVARVERWEGLIA